jgi:hypothetical protein
MEDLVKLKKFIFASFFVFIPILGVAAETAG